MLGRRMCRGHFLLNWKGKMTVKCFSTLLLASALFCVGCTPPPAATVNIDATEVPTSTTTDAWSTTTDAWSTTTDAWDTTTDVWDAPADAWNTTTDDWGATDAEDGFAEP